MKILIPIIALVCLGNSGGDYGTKKNTIKIETRLYQGVELQWRGTLKDGSTTGWRGAIPDLLGDGLDIAVSDQFLCGTETYLRWHEGKLQKANRTPSNPPTPVPLRWKDVKKIKAGPQRPGSRWRVLPWAPNEDVGSLPLD